MNAIATIIFGATTSSILSYKTIGITDIYSGFIIGAAMYIGGVYLTSESNGEIKI